MEIKLLEAEPFVIIWQLLILFVFIFVFFLLIRYLIKKRNTKKNLSLLLIFSLFLFGSCDTNENLFELDFLSFVEKYGLEKIDTDSLDTQNYLYFDSVEDADEFLEIVRESYYNIPGYIETNTRFKSNNPNWEGMIFKEFPMECEYIPNRNSVLKSQPVDGSFCQPYTLVNSICVIFDNIHGHYKVDSRMSGYTLGLGYKHIFGQAALTPTGIVNFVITFQISLVMFVEGIGTVYCFG